MEILERKTIRENEKYKDLDIPIVEEEKQIPICMGDKVFMIDPRYPAIMSHYLRKEYNTIIDIIRAKKDIAPEMALSQNIGALIKYIVSFLGLQYLKTHKGKKEVDLSRKELFIKSELEELEAVGISENQFMTCEHSEIYNAFVQITNLKNPTRGLTNKDKELLESQLPFLAQINDPGLVQGLMIAREQMDLHAGTLKEAYQAMENLGKIVFAMKSSIEKHIGEKLDLDFSTLSLNADSTMEA